MDDRTRSRARNPLPEEREAGVADTEDQAEALLEESDERQFLREQTGREFRQSEETVDPVDDQPTK